jgi:hypothetical protein
MDEKTETTKYDYKGGVESPPLMKSTFLYKYKEKLEDNQI